MEQITFEQWHAGKPFLKNGREGKLWVDKTIFSELDSESAILSKLLEENNPWEAYYRINSWLQALNKFVTYYNGEVGTRRTDIHVQEPMVRFLRWIGENNSLISQVMAGIGAEYYSITESPAGILLTVSFRLSSQDNTASQSANQAFETTSPPTYKNPIMMQPSGSRASASSSIGQTAGPRMIGFSPNEMRSNVFNPNNAAYTAVQINRSNQMNPNNRSYKLSRKRR
ncbi:hypothetical protein ACFLTS_01485 [Chloroflexota bacterium]